MCVCILEPEFHMYRLKLSLTIFLRYTVPFITQLKRYNTSEDCLTHKDRLIGKLSTKFLINVFKHFPSE